MFDILINYLSSHLSPTLPSPFPILVFYTPVYAFIWQLHHYKTDLWLSELGHVTQAGNSSGEDLFVLGSSSIPPATRTQVLLIDISHLPSWQRATQFILQTERQTDGWTDRWTDSRLPLKWFPRSLRWLPSPWQYGQKPQAKCGPWAAQRSAGR